MNIILSNTTSVVDVANYFIYLDCNDIHSKRFRVTPLKLQKLLYYSQAFTLSATKEVLFHEEILAWDYGPVVKKIYYLYKNFGSSPIELEDCDLQNNLDRKQRTIVEGVYNIFKLKTGSEMVKSTHKEDPWKNTYKTENEIIDKVLIYNYFKQIMA